MMLHAESLEVRIGKVTDWIVHFEFLLSFID